MAAHMFVALRYNVIKGYKTKINFTKSIYPILLMSQRQQMPWFSSTAIYVTVP